MNDQQVRDRVDQVRRRDLEERAAYFDEEFRTLDAHRTVFPALDADAPRFQESQTIGSYIIRGELGRGGMGTAL